MSSQYCSGIQAPQSTELTAPEESSILGLQFAWDCPSSGIQDGFSDYCGGADQTVTITDPEGNIAIGPMFYFTSDDGTIGIFANGDTVDFSATLGPFVQRCIQLCSGAQECWNLPAAWFISSSPSSVCIGSQGPPGSQGVYPPLVQWYCLTPPSGAQYCSPCTVVGSQYCVAYPSFDGAQCADFSSAGYQTVSTGAQSCEWIWTDGTCYITMYFDAGYLIVEFGTAPYDGTYGIYETTFTSTDWNCLTGSITVPIGDSSLYPDSPASITVYADACPPPATSCGDCDSPPEFVCVTVTGLTNSTTGQEAGCQNCALITEGVTLTYTTDISFGLGEELCGWLATLDGGAQCAYPSEDIVLYYDPIGSQWVLEIGGGSPVTYTANSWGCDETLTMDLVTASIDSGNTCTAYPSTVDIVIGECSPPPIIWTAPADGDYNFMLYGPGGSAVATISDGNVTELLSGSGGATNSGTLTMAMGDTVQLIAGVGAPSGVTNGIATSVNVLTGANATAYATAGTGGTTTIGGPGWFGGLTPYDSGGNTGSIASPPSPGSFGPGGSGCAGPAGDGAIGDNGNHDPSPGDSLGGAGGGATAGWGPAGGNGGNGDTGGGAQSGQFPGGGGGGGYTADGHTATPAGSGANGAVYINGVRVA